MGKTKRGQEAIKKRVAAKRKHEDALLGQSGFSHDNQELLDGHLSAGEKDRWEDEEQDYELAPRTLRHNDEGLVEGLPIKVGGKVERNLFKKAKKNEPENQSDENDVSFQNDQEAEDDFEAGEVEEVFEEEPDTEAKIIELKEEISTLVESLMEDPEENIHAMTRLCKMVSSKNVNTCKFSMLSLVVVFNSLIPSYKIRPLTDLEKKEKVSKDVAKLRNFEQTLVANYKTYLELLEKLAKTPMNDTAINVNLGVLAINALNKIIPNSCHFNFRAHILTILIRRVCKPNISGDPAAAETIKTIERLLRDDEEGNISLDVMRITSKIIKTRKYNVNDTILNVFLSLDVLHDYDPNTKADDRSIEVKQKKKDRVHFSKKQRKARKELKAIEEEMRKAEQTVSAEEREKNQAEVLIIVLSLYLNILKEGSSDLIGPVLEGLAKFGNMANFDLLGDFLEVLKEVIQTSMMEDLTSLGIRRILLCIVSSFSLIYNVSQSRVHVDLSKFVDILYSILPQIATDAEIELSYKSMRLFDPLEDTILKPSVNVSTKAELLLRALDHIFFRSKSGTKERATAFTKRIYICMQHTPEKTTLALLKFIEKLTHKHPEINGMFNSEERIGNGRFNLEASSCSRSNPEAATLWENSLLKNHYCSQLAQNVKAIANNSKSSTK